jgi:hypothetical protein
MDGMNSRRWFFEHLAHIPVAIFGGAAFYESVTITADPPAAIITKQVVIKNDSDHVWTVDVAEDGSLQIKRQA